MYINAAAAVFAPRLRGFNNGNETSVRIAVVGLANMLSLLLWSLPFVQSSPIIRQSLSILEDGPAPTDSPSTWVYLGTAVGLVLLGGAFAGLTIALMGQDEIYLQVIATSGDGSERRNARKVLKLLKKGKHWVLVTLLLGNVITNETLPIVLDRSLGGGWPAVLSSTVLIVIFGEIAPQSVCVRYGLPIGAWMSPFVLCLMWLLAPVAWPTAKLLDKLLGEDHGTTYKKSGLKTLVTLHKTLGTIPDERLNEDEVTIISAVLDLKGKPVGSIMTPMSDVFTLSADAVLDENLMDIILLAGYSRIPIYAPDDPRNFIGMLLVKMLITYDPEDCLRVRDFALATLPETRPETSCLDIVNFFQEGKSHMVLVSDSPGDPYGALGVVTLEDVIEELIGEEIIDESDVFIDVHKAIRRMTPAPRYRVPKGEVVTDGTAHHPEEHKGPPGHRRHSADMETVGSRKYSASEFGTSPRATTFLMRRRSSGAGSLTAPPIPVALRSNTPEIKHHLKHLGPSNAASRPKTTRIGTVKIKPGVDTIPEGSTQPRENGHEQTQIIVSNPTLSGGVGQGFLASAGRQASDGVHALTKGYGTLSSSPSAKNQTNNSEAPQADGDAHDGPTSPRGENHSPQPVAYHKNERFDIENIQVSRRSSTPHSTLGSLRSRSRSPQKMPRLTVRSGSITESFVDLGGIKKMVLETTSSSDENETPTRAEAPESHEGAAPEAGGKGKKKQRKKRAGRKKKAKEDKDGHDASKETEPLLGKR